MLPIAGETAPTTTDELISALKGGFEARGLTPREITAEGPDFPQLATLKVDLTDGHISHDMRVASDTGNSAGTLAVGHLEIFAEPLYFEKAPLHARIEADGVSLRVAADGGNGSLVLESARAGVVSVTAEIATLETLLQALASKAAANHGIEVKKTKLTLDQDGPRGISFRVEVTAKVFVMSPTLALTGRADIDDAFNARLSSLDFGGDAMVTSLAGGFIRPKLQALEGREFPLLAFSPGGLKLHDIEVAVKPALALRARFGAEA